MADFPPEVEAALERLLSLFREDRERWPLWTYRRDGLQGTSILPEAVAGTQTWTGQRTADGELRWSWAARLRWSSMWTVFAVMDDLDRMARASGMKLILPGSGNAEIGVRRRHEDGSEGDVPVGFAPGADMVLLRRGEEFVPVKVPVHLQARTAAAFALTAADGTPESPEEVHLPDAYMARGFLDDHDFRELLGCIGMSLLRGQPSRLSMFLRRIEEVTKRKEDRGEGWEDVGRDRFDRLAGEVFRDAGLQPKTQGGAGDKIRGRLLGRLMDEAEDIVSEVRAWALEDEPPEYSEAVCALLQANGRDLTPGTKMKLGLQLRFPVLTLPEMQLIRGEVNVGAIPDSELERRFPYLEREERTHLYGRGVKARRAASILIRGRLPGNLGYGGLQNRLD